MTNSELTLLPNLAISFFITVVLVLLAFLLTGPLCQTKLGYLSRVCQSGSHAVLLLVVVPPAGVVSYGVVYALRFQSKSRRRGR